ncbi:MAG: thioredoxin domain-containing protein [Opitutaceae bacterium]
MANKVAPAPKSRTPFFLLLLVIVVAGAGGIYAKMDSSKTKPIVLAPGTPLPTSEGYLRGNANAPVSIVEFGDFECPSCGSFATITEPDLRKRVIDAGLASFRFYDYPLPMHANTMTAHLAAACADHQGKFWEMHDALFEGQTEWNGQATTNPRKVIAGYVKKLGLDEAAWNSCFDSQKDVARIESHKAAGTKLNVNSTPTFVIDNRMYDGQFTYDAMKKLVDSLTAAKGAVAPAPAPAKK